MPASARVFRTDRLDEARSFVVSQYGEHARTQLGSGPLGFESASWQVGGLAIGLVRARQAQRLRAPLVAPLLHLPLQSHHVYQCAGRVLLASPATAVLFPTQAEYVMDSHPGEAVGVLLPANRLARERSQRLAESTPGGAAAWTGLEIPLHGPAGVALHSWLKRLGDVGDDASDAHALVEAGLIGWAVDQLPQPEARLARPWSDAARLRRLEEWLEDRLATPLSLGQLCEVAGVGARALQLAFLRRRGCAPMAHVASRRLAHARVRLLQARPHESVTSIAHDCGLVHLGRFAQAYRAAHGEAPAQTLARARGERVAAVPG